MTHALFKKYPGHPFATVECMPAFHDTDAMQVVWHGNYFKYFELARCAVLKKIDYDYPQMQSSGYAWPIIDARSRYAQAAQYGDTLSVSAVIVEWEIRLAIKYVIVNIDNGKTITRGQSVQVPVNIESGKMEIGCPTLLSERINEWQKSSR